MLSLIGFAAQVCLFLSITAIVISCATTPRNSDVVTSATCISCAEDTVSISDDATQLVAYSALSMASPVYVTTIDEPAPSPDDYSALTIRQLKALCRERGVKRYSSLRKHELISLLQH